MHRSEIDASRELGNGIMKWAGADFGAKANDGRAIFGSVKIIPCTYLVTRALALSNLPKKAKALQLCKVLSYKALQYR